MTHSLVHVYSSSSVSGTSVDWYGGSVNQWEVLLQKAQCTVWQVQVVALFTSYKSNTACQVQFRLNVTTASTDPFSIFILWLWNCDLLHWWIGCLFLYPNMAVCLPVYIWMLVGLMMIHFSHFSRKFANLLGNNPVSVLHGNTHPPLLFSTHWLLQLT